MAGRIIAAIVAALPGLVKLVQAFKKKDEPSYRDITDRATDEIEELESWREHSQKQSQGLESGS